MTAEPNPKAETDSRVASIEAIRIQLPVRRRWRWRGLDEDVGNWVLVRVETDDGLIGWGEATPLADWGGDFGHYYGETPTTVVHVVEELFAPAVVGVAVWDEGDVQRRLTGAIRGHPYARAALEMAIWDLRGKLSGQPVHRLLGGAVRSKIPIAHMLGLMDPDDVLDEVHAASADGVRAFQIKLTGDIRSDVELVAAVRGAAGPESLLRADVNQGYACLPLKKAVPAVAALADAGIDLVEQPVEGLRAMAAIRASVDVEVIGDESCWDVHDTAEAIRADAVDAISIYVAKAGGINPAWHVAAVAEAYHVRCDVNGSLESGIGTLASVQLAAACPAISLPCVISVPAPAGEGGRQCAGRYYADDVLVAAPGFNDGCLEVPCGPGLGIDIDEAKVRALARNLSDR